MIKQKHLDLIWVQLFNEENNHIETRTEMHGLNEEDEELKFENHYFRLRLEKDTPTMTNHLLKRLTYTTRAYI